MPFDGPSRAAKEGWGEMAEQPPAGWMIDPEQPGMLRFWNGEEWTEHRTPRQQVPPTDKVELPS